MMHLSELLRLTSFSVECLRALETATVRLNEVFKPSGQRCSLRDGFITTAMLTISVFLSCCSLLYYEKEVLANVEREVACKPPAEAVDAAAIAAAADNVLKANRAALQRLAESEQQSAQHHAAVPFSYAPEKIIAAPMSRQAERFSLLKVLKRVQTEDDKQAFATLASSSKAQKQKQVPADGGVLSFDDDMSQPAAATEADYDRFASDDDSDQEPHVPAPVSRPGQAEAIAPELATSEDSESCSLTDSDSLSSLMDADGGDHAQGAADASGAEIAAAAAMAVSAAAETSKQEFFSESLPRALVASKEKAASMQPRPSKPLAVVDFTSNQDTMQLGKHRQAEDVSKFDVSDSDESFHDVEEEALPPPAKQQRLTAAAMPSVPPKAQATAAVQLPAVPEVACSSRGRNQYDQRELTGSGLKIKSAAPMFDGSMTSSEMINDVEDLSDDSLSPSTVETSKLPPNAGRPKDASSNAPGRAPEFPGVFSPEPVLPALAAAGVAGASAEPPKSEHLGTSIKQLAKEKRGQVVGKSAGRAAGVSKQATASRHGAKQTTSSLSREAPRMSGAVVKRASGIHPTTGGKRAAENDKFAGLLVGTAFMRQASGKEMEDEFRAKRDGLLNDFRNKRKTAVKHAPKSQKRPQHRR